VTTQVYVQAVLSGRDVRQSRIGTIVAGVGTTVFGLGGVAVGMFIRSTNDHRPGAGAALVRGALLLPGASGIMLGRDSDPADHLRGRVGAGIATMITRDLYQHYIRPQMQDREGIMVARTTIGGDGGAGSVDRRQ